MRSSGVVVLLLLAAACAEPGTEPPGSPPATASEAAAEFDRRAGEVADAWRDTEAATSWRTGLLLLEPQTMPPADPGPEEVAQALQAGWLETDLDLPADPPDDGEVIFDDGDAQPVGLVSLAEAWQAVYGGDPGCPEESPPPPAPSPSGDPDSPVGDRALCTVLTVTGAELGATTVMTSRGPAEVPAWLFEVEGVDEPLAQVAVRPEELTKVPVLAGIEFRHFPGLANAMNLVSIDGAQLTFQLGVGACDIDIAPLVHEADDVVVLGGTTRLDPTVTACTDQLLLEELTVTLADPVGQRPVLATTGEVLTFGRW